jgi:hypothetical protein
LKQEDVEPIDESTLTVAIAVIRSEGGEAQVRGASRRSNPCRPGSVFWNAWAEGWDVSATISRRLAEPLFQLVRRSGDQGE